MPPHNHIRPLGKHPATKRLARLINERYDGNISEAARALGCSYDQLYTAAKGIRSRGPSIELLAALARATGIPIETWIKEDR